MKLSHISLATVLLLAASAAFAQAKPAEPDYSLSFNVGATTDYRFRGLSQSRLKPAVFGGMDFAHKSGFYLGAWGSTIKWIKDDGLKAAVNSGSSNVEIDLYGGYKGSINKDVGFDVGLLQYIYPGNKYKNISGSKADTTEIYGALTIGPVTAKYSHSLSNLFGFAAPGVNSKGSSYLDLTANFDLGGGWSVAPHIGHQKVKNFSVASYTDYSLAVNKDLGNGLVLTGALVGTDAGKTAGIPNYPAPDSTGAASVASKDNGRDGIVLSIKYNF
ncbi:MAG: hypothetical protein HC765_06135 [Brachymonas sp.]|nr:hypothetical protein [Brachymonas sp.]